MSLVPLLKQPRLTLPREAIYWHYPHYHPGGATPYGAIRAGLEAGGILRGPSRGALSLAERPGGEERSGQEDARDGGVVAREAARVADRRGAQMPSPNPAYDAEKDRTAAEPKKSSGTTGRKKKVEIKP